MANNYTANIQLTVQGQDRLRYVLNSVEKLNSIISRLKPINLLAPGRGAGADLIGQTKKQLDDFSRAIVNFKPEGIQKRAKELSNTLAGSAAQADALTIALENVGLKTGGFSRQATEVKNYALALEQARRNTERLNAISQQVQRGARIQTIAERFNVSPITVEQRLNNIRDIRYAKDRKAEADRYMALKREEDFELRLQRIRERNAATQAAQVAQQERNRAIGGRVRGALSNAAIGGAFPLLFGQGAGAATGGAIGGLIGGAFGGTGGFAGSLLGTLIGDIASRGEAIRKLGQDIGFSVDQTKQLAEAFSVANTDVEKFTAVIQNIRGLGLELEDQAKAIQLVTRLTEVYGGTFEKTGNAITSALEAGKVTQATLNQLTSQGIDIQQALADKYGINRDALLQMAKDGKISVQSLIDTLVDLGNKPGQVAKQTQTASVQFQTAIQNLTKVVGPELERLGRLFTQFGATALNALTGVLSKLGQVGQGIENAIAGDTLKNAQTQFRRDSKTLKQLYATPVNKRTPEAVQQITALETLQKGRLEVINAAKPKQQPALQTFTVPSQLPPAGEQGAKDKTARDAARLAEEIAKQKAAALEALAVEKGRLMVAETADPIQQKITAAIVKQNDIQREYATKIKESQSAEATLNLQLAERNALQANALDLQRALSEEIDNLTQPLTDLIQASSDRLAFENKYQEVLARGINPELAKIYAQLELAADKQNELLTLRLAELEAAKAKLKPESDVAKALQEQIDKIKEIQRLRGQQVDQGKKDADEEDRRRTEREKKEKQARDQMELVQQQVAAIGATLGDQLMGVFDNLITKTRDWNDVLRDALMGIGKILMMAGLNILAGTDGKGVLSFLGFGSGFGQRAAGGPVTGRTPYIVGERGPELFVPNTGGSVVPTNDLRAAMGSAPGSAGGPVLNMSFETTNIGGVEYVSREQLEQAMAATRRQAASDGAKRGMSMTLDRIQQSPQTRNRLGMR